ncbi:MAG: DnaJ domain-containing protein, partial [Candidatus Gracilibacteria bacterium]|nr:DnaJ domain-containing protein [Candidatus Gracilibacteria bacterium]
MPENYYDILGIPKNAGEEEIKKAYRKLAMQHHPDRTGGDKESEKKFKKINEAYSVLGDTKKRANYDKFGNADGFSGFSGGNSGGGFSGFDVNFDFGDIFEGFESFFGGSRRGGSARKDIKGEDIEIRI